MSDILFVLFVLCVFLFLVACVKHYARTSLIPPVCWILLIGTVYGLLIKMYPSLPKFELTPQLVFYVFLPLLIYEASRHIQQVTKVFVEVSLFATVGVIAAVAIIGIPFSYFLRLPLLDALFFGAIAAATDSTAIGSIFKRFKLPKKLYLLVEGESLANDGTILVLFTILFSIIVQHMSFQAVHSVGLLVWSLVGAVIFGGVVGFLSNFLLRLWQEHHNPYVGLLITFVTVYASFVIGEHVLHMSGVIALMTTSIILQRGHTQEQKTKEHEREKQFSCTFWSFFGDLANHALFFFLGVHIGIHQFNLPLLLVPLAIAILLFSRSVVIYGGSWILRRMGRTIKNSWQHVLNIAGFKGALSVALIFLIPLDYPYRNLFLCTVYAFILFTLLVNTLVMHRYLKSAKL